MHSVAVWLTPPRRWLAVIVVASLLWTGWYGTQAVWNTQVVDVPSEDIPHAWQTMWNVAHGHGFRYTDVRLQQDLPRMSAHADYFLILISPLTWFTQRYEALVWLQTIMMASGALALWLIGRRLTGRDALGAFLAGAYLLSGPIQFTATFQFHAVALALPFLLWAAEALIARRRWWVVWIWFGLALLTKEQVGLVGGMMLGWMAWRDRRRTLAAWLVGLGTVWTIAHFAWIIPAVRPDTDPHLFWRYYYGSLGQTPQEIIPKLLTPSTFFSRFLLAENIRSILFLLVGLAGLPLMNPLILLAGVTYLPHLLADTEAVRSLYYQNHILAMAPLMMAAAYGLQRLWRSPRLKQLRLVTIFGGPILVMLGSAMYSPNPWSVAYRAGFRDRDPRVGAIATLAPLIPPNVTIATAWGLPPLFRSHPTVHILPAGISRAEYVVVGPSALQAVHDYAPNYASDLMKYFAASAAWVRVAEAGDVVLYRRQPERPIDPLPPGFVDPTLHGKWFPNET